MDNAGCVRDTSRKENESRAGWSAGQDGHGHFRMKFSHRGDVSRMHKFRMNKVARPQEKLSRMSREH